MSKAVEDAIAAREAAKRPAPPPAPASKKGKKTKVNVTVKATVTARQASEDEVKDALARLEKQHNALTTSEGEDPGFTTLVERESDDERTFEVPSS